ncbi:MAG: hypothetical protein NZT92_16735 [Abditibacteriales bacterium]|nr:hypothetical protein [Abditibacteriales bacterium]
MFLRAHQPSRGDGGNGGADYEKAHNAPCPSRCEPRRWGQEVILHLVNGQAQFEPSDKIHTQGNELGVDNKRIVVKMAG